MHEGNWQRLAASVMLAWLPCAAVAACGGHGDHNSMVVPAAWLAEHLKDPNLVMLGIGQQSEYEGAHIPGSQFLSYPDIYLPKSQEGLRVELPPMERLTGIFEKLGVSNGSRIVLYPLENWSSQTARVYLTLDAMGLGARASILDGGLPVWRSEGRPVTKDAPTVARGKLEPCPQTDVIAKLDFVRASMRKPGVDIVDARNPEYYTGAQVPAGQRAGHIPGSSNITFSTLLDEKGKLLPDEAIEAKFRDAGIQPGDCVVSYCHIGQQASLVYFVARYLGYDARMYDGSWDEWSAHAELPADTGAYHR
ncbi:MAG TPA: sulfurtransferase [Bryobacteraceae bacterium]|nr:sulfurtransferase [Bryobacteraceae bacterium]